MSIIPKNKYTARRRFNAYYPEHFLIDYTAVTSYHTLHINVSIQIINILCLWSQYALSLQAGQGKAGALAMPSRSAD